MSGLSLWTNSKGSHLKGDSVDAVNRLQKLTHPSEPHTGSDLIDPIGFKEALRKANRATRPVPPTHSTIAALHLHNQQVSASIHPMIHPAALSSVTGDAPCFLGHN